MAAKEFSKRTKPGRKPLNKPRHHIVFEPDVNAFLVARKESTGRERSWLVNHYLKIGMASEKAA